MANVQRSDIEDYIERVRISSDDRSALFLSSKLIAGTDITLNTLDAGGSEVLEINASGGEGYLEHGTLTISNNSTDSDHDIDVTGGAVGVRNFSGDWRVVELADETPAFQIDTTGDDGLINGSSLTADTWYELGVIADSSGSNSPSVIGYTDANRPTASSDLPTGFDLFRAMGTPGNTWWVRTDGSSNIISFTHSGKWFIWSAEAIKNTLSNPLNKNPSSNSGSFTTNNVPPTKLNSAASRSAVFTGSSGGEAMHLHNESMSGGSFDEGQSAIAAAPDDRLDAYLECFGVTGQKYYWAVTSSSNVDLVFVSAIAKFKAV